MPRSACDPIPTVGGLEVPEAGLATAPEKVSLVPLDGDAEDPGRTLVVLPGFGVLFIPDVTLPLFIRPLGAGFESGDTPWSLKDVDPPLTSLTGRMAVHLSM